MLFKNGEISRTRNYRSIELFRFEETSEIIKSNYPPNATNPLVNHVPKCHIHASLKYFQGW